MIERECPGCRCTIIPKVQTPHFTTRGPSETVSDVECPNCGRRLGQLAWWTEREHGGWL